MIFLGLALPIFSARGDASDIWWQQPPRPERPETSHPLLRRISRRPQGHKLVTTISTAFLFEKIESCTLNVWNQSCWVLGFRQIRSLKDNLLLYEEERKPWKLVLWRHCFKEVGNGVVIIYYAILHYNDTSNLRRCLYALNHTAESLEMTE